MFSVGRSSSGFLYCNLGTTELYFGDFYKFGYTPVNEQKYSFFDPSPLIIFLEYRPSQRHIYGTNLNYVPLEDRIFICEIIRHMKKKINLPLPEKSTFNNQVIQSPPGQKGEIKMQRGPDEKKKNKSICDYYQVYSDDVEKLLKKVTEGKPSFQWSQLFSQRNKFVRVMESASRVYAISGIKRLKSILEYDDGQRYELLTTYSNLRGDFTTSNVMKVANIAKQNGDWEEYLRENFSA